MGGQSKKLIYIVTDLQGFVKPEKIDREIGFPKQHPRLIFIHVQKSISYTTEIICRNIERTGNLRQVDKPWLISTV